MEKMRMNFPYPSSKKPSLDWKDQPLGTGWECSTGFGLAGFDLARFDLARFGLVGFGLANCCPIDSAPKQEP
jgi:hypothetical protein